MKEVVKVLLQEGIDEETIHEVLSVIEEKYLDTPEQRRINLEKAEQDYTRASQAREVNDDIRSDIIAHDTDAANDLRQLEVGDIKAEYKARRGYERAKAKVKELEH